MYILQLRFIRKNTFDVTFHENLFTPNILINLKFIKASIVQFCAFIQKYNDKDAIAFTLCLWRTVGVRFCKLRIPVKW